MPVKHFFQQQKIIFKKSHSTTKVVMLPNLKQFLGNILNIARIAKRRPENIPLVVNVSR